MSGWCPSFSVCGMAVVCAAAVLPGAVVWLVPYSSQCSTHQYCCHVVYCSLPGAAVCGWWTCVCGVRVVGYPLSTPPSSWWRVGPSWTVGCRCGGGWHGEGRAVVLLGSPSVCWCPPCRLPCGPVEWRGGVCAVLPVFGLGPLLHIALALLVLSCPSCIVPVPLLSCVAVFVVGGEVWWCAQYCCCVAAAVLCCATLSCCFVRMVVFFFSFFFPSLCLLSRHCWFRVVSLWQGCVIVE